MQIKNVAGFSMLAHNIRSKEDQAQGTARKGKLNVCVFVCESRSSHASDSFMCALMPVCACLVDCKKKKKKKKHFLGL